jgi:hypothetical protein
MTIPSYTIFYDERGRSFANMYREHDGQPKIHGRELASFFNSFDAVVDGYRPGDRRKLADGMGCVAAQLISHVKKGVGGYYLQHLDDVNNQAYVYHIFRNRIEVFENNNIIFEGIWRQFYEWCYQD